MALLLISPAAREVQVDLELVAGDVRGFREVPDGAHRVSLLRDGAWNHSWIHVATPDDVVRIGTGRMPGAGGGFAADGHGDLVLFPSAQRATWAVLTRHLRRHPACLATTSLAGAAASRAGGADDGLTRHPLGAGAGPERLGALVTAAGGPEELIARFERYFLDGFLTPDTGDLESIAKWRQLLGTLTAGGRAELTRWPDLYPEAIAALQPQVELFGADLLDDGLVYSLDLLAAELIAAPDPPLRSAGLALERLLGH